MNEIKPPQLTDTTGAGLVDFRIMPHMDYPKMRPKIDRILATWPSDLPVVKLNDNQAIIMENNNWRIVHSPKGDLTS